MPAEGNFTSCNRNDQTLRTGNRVYRLKNPQVGSHQLLRNMLVEDFLHGQGDDDFVAALEERFDLLQRIRRVIERHEEAFLAIFAHHHGFKGVNVRATNLVFLFYLEGIPMFFQPEFTSL